MNKIIGKLQNWHIAVVLFIVGIVCYVPGIRSPFQYDDLSQIVYNPVVHSIRNIRFFFDGGTFYQQGVMGHLAGGYFRPLMTTVYSLIYTIFGAHPFYFHLIQIILFIAGVFIFYLVLRLTFRLELALLISLIFLIHPINSEVVDSISRLQDVLFFFFGILGLWVLIRFDSYKGQIASVICLFFAMLGKETAVVFIALCLLFLFWRSRKELLRFISILVLPMTLYLLLKIHAVGLFGASPNNAPILRADILERIYTAPSAVLFYFDKLLWPVKLSTGYYWVYSHISFSHFFIPLTLDLLVLGLLIWGGVIVKHRSTANMFRTYIFFGIWFLLGMLTVMEIIPLDMTASETWFYCQFAGLLGMLGIIAIVLPVKLNIKIVYVFMCFILIVLGMRTFYRGYDYNNPETIAYKDLSASKENYAADDEIASYLIIQGNFNAAKPYVEQSVSIFPYPNNYNLLGSILTSEGNFQRALTAYQTGFKYGSDDLLVEGLGNLTMYIGKPDVNKQYLLDALRSYPQDSSLWFDLAILEDRYGDNIDARNSIFNASQYGQVIPGIYSAIMNNVPFKLYLDAGVTLYVE